MATLLTIAITFIRILKKLRSSPIPLSHSVQNRREQEITNFTYRSCAIFAVCWFPVFTCNMLLRFGGFEGVEMKAARVLAVTISKLSFVVNPYLHHKMLKARIANQIVPVAALNNRRTLGVHHPTCNANFPLQDIAYVVPLELEEPREFLAVPTRQNSLCNSRSAPEPGTTTS